MCLMYDRSGRIYYKLRFSDPEYTLLIQRKDNNMVQTPVENLLQIYGERRKIKKKKYFYYLQELKNTMPDDYQQFYENLPHEE